MSSANSEKSKAQSPSKSKKGTPNLEKGDVAKAKKSKLKAEEFHANENAQVGVKRVPMVKTVSSSNTRQSKSKKGTPNLEKSDAAKAKKIKPKAEKLLANENSQVGANNVSWVETMSSSYIEKSKTQSPSKSKKGTPNLETSDVAKSKKIKPKTKVLPANTNAKVGAKNVVGVETMSNSNMEKGKAKSSSKSTKGAPNLEKNAVAKSKKIKPKAKERPAKKHAQVGAKNVKVETMSNSDTEHESKNDKSEKAKQEENEEAENKDQAKFEDADGADDGVKRAEKDAADIQADIERKLTMDIASASEDSVDEAKNNEDEPQDPAEAQKTGEGSKSPVKMAIGRPHKASPKLKKNTGEENSKESTTPEKDKMIPTKSKNTEPVLTKNETSDPDEIFVEDALIITKNAGEKGNVNRKEGPQQESNQDRDKSKQLYNKTAQENSKEDHAHDGDKPLVSKKNGSDDSHSQAKVAESGRNDNLTEHEKATQSPNKVDLGGTGIAHSEPNNKPWYSDKNDMEDPHNETKADPTEHNAQSTEPKESASIPKKLKKESSSLSKGADPNDPSAHRNGSNQEHHADDRSLVSGGEKTDQVEKGSKSKANGKLNSKGKDLNEASEEELLKIGEEVIAKGERVLNESSKGAQDQGAIRGAKEENDMTKQPHEQVRVPEGHGVNSEMQADAELKHEDALPETDYVNQKDPKVGDGAVPEEETNNIAWEDAKSDYVDYEPDKDSKKTVRQPGEHLNSKKQEMESSKVDRSNISKPEYFESEKPNQEPPSEYKNIDQNINAYRLKNDAVLKDLKIENPESKNEDPLVKKVPFVSGDTVKEELQHTKQENSSNNSVQVPSADEKQKTGEEATYVNSKANMYGEKEKSSSEPGRIDINSTHENKIEDSSKGKQENATKSEIKANDGKHDYKEMEDSNKLHSNNKEETKKGNEGNQSSNVDKESKKSDKGGDVDRVSESEKNGINTEDKKDKLGSDVNESVQEIKKQLDIITAKVKKPGAVGLDKAKTGQDIPGSSKNADEKDKGEPSKTETAKESQKSDKGVDVHRISESENEKGAAHGDTENKKDKLGSDVTESVHEIKKHLDRIAERVKKPDTVNEKAKINQDKANSTKNTDDKHESEQSKTEKAKEKEKSEKGVDAYRIAESKNENHSTPLEKKEDKKDKLGTDVNESVQEIKKHLDRIAASVKKPDTVNDNAKTDQDIANSSKSSDDKHQDNTNSSKDFDDKRQDKATSSKNFDDKHQENANSSKNSDDQYKGEQSKTQKSKENQKSEKGVDVDHVPKSETGQDKNDKPHDNSQNYDERHTREQLKTAKAKESHDTENGGNGIRVPESEKISAELGKESEDREAKQDWLSTLIGKLSLKTEAIIIKHLGHIAAGLKKPDTVNEDGKTNQYKPKLAQSMPISNADEKLSERNSTKNVNEEEKYKKEEVASKNYTDSAKTSDINKTSNSVLNDINKDPDEIWHLEPATENVTVAAKSEGVETMSGGNVFSSKRSKKKKKSSAEKRPKDNRVISHREIQNDEFDEEEKRDIDEEESYHVDDPDEEDNKDTFSSYRRKEKSFVMDDDEEKSEKRTNAREAKFSKYSKGKSKSKHAKEEEKADTAKDLKKGKDKSKSKQKEDSNAREEKNKSKDGEEKANKKGDKEKDFKKGKEKSKSKEDSNEREEKKKSKDGEDKANKKGDKAKDLKKGKDKSKSKQTEDSDDQKNKDKSKDGEEKVKEKLILEEIEEAELKEDKQSKKDSEEDETHLESSGENRRKSKEGGESKKKNASEERQKKNKTVAHGKLKPKGAAAKHKPVLKTKRKKHDHDM